MLGIWSRSTLQRRGAHRKLKRRAKKKQLYGSNGGARKKNGQENRWRPYQSGERMVSSEPEGKQSWRQKKEVNEVKSRRGGAVSSQSYSGGAQRPKSEMSWSMKGGSIYYHPGGILFQKIRRACGNKKNERMLGGGNRRTAGESGDGMGLWTTP